MVFMVGGSLCWWLLSVSTDRSRL